MKRLLILIFILTAGTADAQQRCSLDTTNPALTQGFIPIHGGSFQGVTGYNNPSEWPYLSYQAHWACPNCNGMTFDDSQGLLNPATSHIHLEVCLPAYSQITGPIIVPFRMRAYHLKGQFYFNSGPMVRDAIFDIPQDVPWHHFDGDPMGVVAVTGHFTFDPHGGDGGPNIHGASPNGWTIWMAGAIALLDNGDVLGTQGELPIFTLLDPTVPENPGFEPNTSSGAGISSVKDGGSAVWGAQISEVRQDFLPLLAPFNTIWNLPHMFGYMYGGKVGFDGIFGLHKDVDLHNGVIGILIPGAPLSGSGPGFLDPVSIGTGTHPLSLIWQVKTGPDGLPGIAAPNETVTSLLVFNVTVGPNTIPPPTCSDPVTTSSNTVTSDWTVGVNQSRTIVTTVTQTRICQ